MAPVFATLGMLAIPTMVLAIPFVLFMVWDIEMETTEDENEYQMNIGRLSYSDILKTHHDDLQDALEMQDARSIVNSPSFMPNETEFAFTFIEQVESIKQAKREILFQSRSSECPLYVLNKIVREIDDETEYFQCSTPTLFLSNPSNTSVISGVQYDLLVQKSDESMFALVLSVYGIQFYSDYPQNRDNKIERRKRKRAKPIRIKNVNSVDSISSSDEMQKYYEFMDQQIDQNFELHLRHDTIPKLKRFMDCFT